MAVELDDLTDAERKALAQCRHAVLGVERPLRLDCGVDLGPYRVAYQTYGTLNPDKSNAVLICHALTLDQFVAEQHPVTGKEGWWESLVGPGKVLDPARYFIICVNVLGGCMGTTGPLAREPASGQPWNLRFPVVTIGDMVRAQAALLDHLGIPDLFCVIGGSMGGMQVLEWAASYPRRVVLRRADRLRRAPFGAEHRLPRGRPPGDHGRSRMEGRRLPPAPDGAGARPGGRAHDRAHHLSFRAGAAAQVRPRPAGPQRAGLRLRRRLPGRELPAPPGLDLRRPLRRQQLPLHHAGDGLFRPRRRPWRRAGQRLPRHADALLPDVLHQRLAVPDAREPRDRPCAERGRRQRLLRRGRERQGPRRLPARRAGDVPHPGRLPQGRGGRARA